MLWLVPHQLEQEAGSLGETEEGLRLEYLAALLEDERREAETFTTHWG